MTCLINCPYTYRGKMENFVNAHVHSQFSLLDGLDSPTTIAKRAAELGQPGITLTDHGTISGHRELQKACAEEGIKAILGVEAYYSFDRFDRTPVAKRDDNTDLYSHLILIAKNQNGLKNITKIVEESWKSYYYKPLTDFELISEYSDDLIITTACMGGAVSKLILANKLDHAELVLNQFKELRGDDFFIELQTHNPKELNEELIRFSNKMNIPCIVATDAHYVREEDRAIEEAFLILSSHPKLGEGVSYEGSRQYEDLIDKFNYLYPDRTMSFDGIDLFLHSREQMEAAMKKAGIYSTDYLDATVEIANRVEGYEFYQRLDLLPTPKGKSPNVLLRNMCMDGLAKRGLKNNQKALDRLEVELKAIETKELSTYFLIVRDVINWSKGEGVSVGTGRGSGAGSLVCYLLSITEINPLEYDLLFDRFINVGNVEEWSPSFGQ